jgi:hypothetical protein
LTTTLVAEAIGFPARVALCCVGMVCACARRAHDGQVGEKTELSELSCSGDVSNDDEDT